MTIKALLFDLDGTLINTREANYIAYKKAFLNEGKNLSEESYNKNFGLCFNDLIKNIFPSCSQIEKDRIKSEKTYFYKKNFCKTKLNPSLKSILLNNRSRYKTAIVTTASKINAVEILKYHGLHNMFDVFIFGEDVKNGKPHPECYNLAMQLLGIRSSECLVYEDSSIGIEAAKSSGASVINVSGWIE